MKPLILSLAFLGVIWGMLIVSYCFISDDDVRMDPGAFEYIIPETAD